jgi:putative chitinase
MVLTFEQLKAITPGTPDDRIKLFLPHLNKYLPQYGIDTPIEVASFLSQILHESGGFKYLREIWGPTAAQLRYEGRRDLGNNFTGDGKKFMGRGLMQITGRLNYARMSNELFNDDRLLENPDILATPEFSTQSACVYWKWRNMDKYDDDDDITKETKLVNGGFNGLDDRKEYFERAKKALVK